MKHIAPILAVLAFAPVCAGQYLDSRSRAMGGAAVASGHYSTAGFVNPALLSRFDDGDRFSFILPSVGAIVSDPDGLVEAIDDFQDEVDRVQAAIGNATVTQAQRDSLSASLSNLNNKSAVLDGGGGLSFAMPGETLSWGLFLSTNVDALVTPRIDAADINTIQNTNNPNDLENLSSEGRVLGVAVTELAFAVSTKFEVGGIGIAVGAAPKAQRVETYNYSININTFDDNNFDDDQFRDDETKFNFDLGAVAMLTPAVTVGLAARNLIENDFQTVVTNGASFTRTVGPTVKLGAAVALGGLTIAADIDVVEIERFKGFSDESRFFNVGLEFDTLGWLQLRAGFQTDLEDTVENLFSAGLGLSPFNTVHIDLTGIYGDGDTYGALAQLWFTF